MKKHVLVLSIIFCCFKSQAQSTTPIYINEFMASNGSTTPDITGNFEDWIELHNGLSTTFDLSGFYLSDDPNNLTKFEIPQNTTVSGGGFLVFWASGDTGRGSTHTNFRLSASQGEFVILTAPNGTSIIDSIGFGPQTTDVSYGRFPNGANNWVYFKPATPGASNNNSTPFSTVLQPPVFSQTGGFYSNSLSLSISAPDSGVVIYYTLDGSEPSPSRLTPQGYIYKNQYPQFPNSPAGPNLHDSIRSFTYSGPLSIVDRNNDANRTSSKSSTFEFSPPYLPSSPVRKGTVVRAIAYRPDAIPSAITTETFFVGSSIVNHFSLPVLSLSIDENLMFDYFDCFYCAGAMFENWRNTSSANAQGNSPANWHRSGGNFEYPMGLEYFDSQGQKQFGQLVGGRIHGGWSRARRRKTFRFYARSSYGESAINYPLFSQRQDNSYQRVLLRNSGNDENVTIFRDAFIQNLVSHLKFDIQHSEPAVVFINGEYWGINNLREWQNRHYIERLYGVTPDELDFLTPFRQPNDGDALHFNQMMSYITANNLSNDSLFAEVNRRMDVEDFTDYVIAEVYSRNTDWPVNNIKWWRKRVPFDPSAPEGHDGRWRWLMYDMDFGFGWNFGVAGADHNTLNHARVNGDVGILLRNLWPNAEYSRYFVNRYADLLNTCFLPEHVEMVVDSMEAIYAPEMAEHIARWGHHSSITDWEDDVEVIREWSEVRPGHARLHLRNQFQLPASHTLSVDVSDTLAGYVKVNTIDILRSTVGINDTPYPWEGIYFQNNSIDLEANAFPGYIFSHWEIGGVIVTNNPINLNMTSDTLIIAHFDTDSLIVCGTQPSHILADCPYIFEEWSPQSTSGTTPPNMEFVYFDELDPSDTAEIAGRTSGAFDLSSRTRINGLNADGLGFINTGNTDGNPGYPGTQLGGAILHLNTENMNRGFVQWTGGTITPGSRVYHIRLQYRLGDRGPWTDLLDSNGNVIEYRRNANFNHSEIIGPHALPTNAMGRECLQLMWRYYHTGQRLSQSSGARDFLRLDDIIVSEGETPTSPLTTIEGTGAGIISGNRTVMPSETNGYGINVIPGATYDWTVTNGSILAGQNTPQISVQWGSNGVGSVRVDVQDGDCHRIAEAMVNISGISIESFNEDKGIVVFPNPSKNRFQLQLNEDLQAESLRIIDGSGRVVYEQSMANQMEVEVVHNLPAGKYNLQVLDARNGIIHRQGLIVTTHNTR